MKYAVLAWVELDGKLHKLPEVLELDDAVAQPLVERGVLESVQTDAPQPKAKSKADAEGKV